MWEGLNWNEHPHDRFEFEDVGWAESCSGAIMSTPLYDSSLQITSFTYNLKKIVKNMSCLKIWKRNIAQVDRYICYLSTSWNQLPLPELLCIFTWIIHDAIVVILEVNSQIFAFLTSLEGPDISWNFPLNFFMSRSILSRYKETKLFRKLLQFIIKKREKYKIGTI